MSSYPFDSQWFFIEEFLSRCLNRKEPSLQRWIDLLSISTKYQLESIRPVAIKGIDTHRPEIDPVQKYALAIKYMVKEWEGSSFKTLCQRPDPLTVEEAIRLGVIITTEVFREREKIRSKPDTTNEAKLPQPVIWLVNPPRGPGTATVPADHESGPSKVSQPNPISAAKTTIESVAGPAAAISTPPNSETVKPTSSKVKVELCEEQDCPPNPQPALSQPHNGRVSKVGNFFASAPPLLPPPVSGKTIQMPSNQQGGNNSARVPPHFSESGDSKKPAPSDPTPMLSRSHGYMPFSGVITSGPLFATTKPTETQGTHKEFGLPVSTSQSRFTFKQ